MTIKIDWENHIINLGVKDLIYFGYLSRQAKLYYLPSGFNRLSLGQQAHQLLQQERINNFPNYQKEFSLKYNTTFKNYNIQIQGRLDGIYWQTEEDEKKKTILAEEIKSVILPNKLFIKLNNTSYRAYQYQLKLYSHFLQKQFPEAQIQSRLLYINLTDEKTHIVEIAYNSDEVQGYIERRLSHILGKLIIEEELRRAKRKASEKMIFPFPELRPYQTEMIQSVERALSEHTSLLISAPPGIGKTIGVLYPMFKFALKNDLKLFYVTAKNTQQHLVYETLKKLDEQDIPSSSIVLHSKERMCINDIYICREEYCEYAKSYGEKLHHSGLLETLSKETLLSPEKIREAAKKVKICPFELALDLSLQCDVIICDYNYVFAPDVALMRFFQDKKYDNLLLIIDEAHNLHKRGCEYYSPELYKSEIKKVYNYCASRQIDIYQELANFYKRLVIHFEQIIKDITEEYSYETINNIANVQSNGVLIQPNKEFFAMMREELEHLMLDYYIYRREYQLFQPEDPLIYFYYDFKSFCNVLELEGEEFVYYYDIAPKNEKFKILCLDSAQQLNKRISGFYQVTAMSATLEPMMFYKDILGFNRDNTDSLILPSPFLTEHRKVLVINNISTRFKDRKKNYSKIAQLLKNIVSLKEGNYIVFFPSFAFLEEVYHRLSSMQCKIHSQKRNMSLKARKQLLDKLHNKNSHNLILAVQGGILAEGVDYPGEMLIGVIVISPGLPQYNLEQELIRNYFAEKYDLGFEYAYIYPGMNRVIQSIGRLIRSETDIGIAILVGERFASEQYQELFPTYWYQNYSAELLVGDYIEDIRQFWEQFNEE